MDCVQYCGLDYSNRFLILYRVCALYPHYGALPPSSTLELVPQEPRNSYHRSGLGLSNETVLPHASLTVSPGITMPSVAPCTPDTPAIAWKTATVVAKRSQTGTGLYQQSGFRDYH